MLRFHLTDRLGNHVASFARRSANVGFHPPRATTPQLFFSLSLAPICSTTSFNAPVLAFPHLPTAAITVFEPGR